MRIAGAACGLLVLAVLLAPFLIPVDRYRPLLVWAIEAATGRSVQIDALQLVLVPSVRIRVLNFRMKNPPGFPAGDALTARSVDLGIAPQALLSRRLDVTDIAPADVQVHVLRDAAGRTNFAVARGKSTVAPGAGPAFTLERIGVVNVTDAEITFADARGSEQPVQAFALKGVSGKIGSIDPRVPDWVKNLDIVADLHGAQLTMSFLTKPVDLHSGRLTLKGGAARGTFSCSLGSVNLTGTAVFARLDPLSIAFSVTGPVLDLKTLAPLLRVDAKERARASTANRLLARGTIKIGNVIFAPLEATQMSGQLDLYTGTLRLNALTLSAYGGSVRGSATLDGSAGIPTAVSAQVRGLNVQRALVAAGLGAKKLTGALDADVKLTTLLVGDPKRALAATGTFAVRDGSFPGLDLTGKLAQAARIASLARLNLPSGDRFSYFGGDLRIARERGYSNALTLLATGLQGTFQGSFGFDQTLAYRGVGLLDVTMQGVPSTGSAAVQQLLGAALQRGVGAGRVRVPFSLRGTLDRPQFALTGTPQFVTSASPGRAAAPQAKPPSAEDLLQLLLGR